MKNFARMAVLAVVATATATPALAVPPGTPVEADPKAQAHVTITKPLILIADADLQFGSVAVYGPGTVSIAFADGTTSCGPVAEMTCDFTGAQRAEYTVRGANNAIVDVNVAPSTLDNGSGGTIAFTPLAQDTLQLNNAGSVGTKLYVGGEVTLAANTAEGVYAGDIELTVEY